MTSLSRSISGDLFRTDHAISLNSTAAANFDPSIPGAALSQFTNMLFSNHYQAIDYLRAEPHLLPLKQVVETFLQQDSNNLNFILEGILVLLGIKPALAIEPLKEDSKTRRAARSQLFTILRNLLPLNPNCQFVELSDVRRTSYFVNEAPMAQFDPRQYIQKEHFDLYQGRIALAIKKTFFYKRFPQVEMETLDGTQFSSYLLGYGPTWEAYIHQFAGFSDVEECPQERIFSEKHYEELGAALDSDCAKGHEYSLHFCQKAHEDQTDPLAEKSKNYLGMLFKTDETSLKTSYLKEMIFHRYRLLQFLTDYTSNPAFAPRENIRRWIVEHMAQGH